LSNIPRFAAYAAAFEKAYEDDEWSALEEFFSEDAVYEIGMPILGAERFEGDRIVHLEDQYTDEMKEETDRFIREYGSKIGVLLSSD